MLTLSVEALLVHMISAGSNPVLEQARLEVLSAFFEDDVFHVATERNGPMSAYKKEPSSIDLESIPVVSAQNPATLEPSPITSVQVPTTPDGQKAPSSSIDEQQGNFIEQCMNELEDALDDLYDMLPVIRTLRHGHVLDLEAAQIPEKPEEVTKSAVLNLQFQDVVASFDDALKSLNLPKESVHDKLARMAKEERDMMAEFQNLLNDDQIERNKKEEIQRILKAVKVGMETSPAAYSKPSDSKAIVETRGNIKDLEKERLHIQYITNVLRKGNEDLRRIERSVL
jgi:hypothetical protein